MRFVINTLLYLFVVSAVVMAQPAQMTSRADSDPAALAVLKKMQERFDGYQTLEVAFSLTYEIPDQPSVPEEGTLQMKGDMYKLDLPGQAVLSDGNDLWLILKEQQEVQINDLDPEAEAGLTPRDLMRLYDRDDLVFILYNEIADRDRVTQQIEMKPLDRSLEFHKVRMDVDKASLDPLNVRVFNKDGSRIKLDIGRISPDQPFPDGHFSFRQADYPGFRIEDLRLD